MASLVQNVIKCHTHFGQKGQMSGWKENRSGEVHGLLRQQKMYVVGCANGDVCDLRIDIFLMAAFKLQFIVHFHEHCTRLIIYAKQLKDKFMNLTYW